MLRRKGDLSGAWCWNDCVLFERGEFRWASRNGCGSGGNRSNGVGTNEVDQFDASPGICEEKSWRKHKLDGACCLLVGPCAGLSEAALTGK